MFTATQFGRGEIRRFAPVLSVAALISLSAGCLQPMADRAERVTRGYVYYLDGAGGGGALRNYAGGVRQGLLDAGYDGGGEMFAWETGLGVAADQTAGNDYKRGKAGELAREIAARRRAQPEAPITLIGLSAGTAIAVFALEALPADTVIENVILLSGSLSATHDLTAALRHVRGRMFVFTSQRDAVLTVLLPLGGTADRGAVTTDVIGVQGPEMPAGSSQATRQLYAAKIVQIPWTERFAAYGHHGGHTDSVKAAFVQHYVAPLVLTTKPGVATVAAFRPPGATENPDYQRWAAFAPGSWVEFEGQQIIAGASTPLRIRVRLVSRSAEAALIAREFLGERGDGLIPRQLFAPATIDPQEHALTHPATRIELRPSVSLTLAGRSYDCQVKAFAAEGEFPGWGSSVRGTVYINDEIPGGIARLELRSEMKGRSIELNLSAAGFSAVRQ